MSTWSRPDPDAGSIEYLKRIGSFLRVSATQLGHLHAEVRSVVSNAREVWSGEAHDEWETQVHDRALIEVTEMQTQHTEAANAIDTYVDEFGEVKRKMGRVRTQVEGVIACGQQCQFLTWNSTDGCYGMFVVTGDPHHAYPKPRVTFASTAGFAPPGSLYSADITNVTQTRIKEFNAWAEFFNAELADQADNMEEQAVRRENADEALANALGNLHPGGWDKYCAVAASLGITDPAMMTDRKIALAMAHDLNDGPGFLGSYQNDLARFEAFYERYAGDAAIMAVFVKALGAKGATRVLEECSDLVQDGTANCLREAFATASRGWTEAEAIEYVDSLFATMDESGVCHFTFLFSGDYQNGAAVPSLAVCRRAADLVDELAASGRRFEIGDQNLVLSDRVERDNWIRVSSPAQQIDTSALYGGVLRSLGRYPNALSGWLHQGASTSGDGVVTCPRVDRWFGIDWAKDGYETPSALLLDLQHATASEHAPQVTGLALRQFVGDGINQAVDPNKITPAASRNFAALVEAVGPGVMNTILAPDDRDVAPSGEDRGLGTMKLPGTETPVATIDNHQYLRLVQWALMRPDGRAMIDAYITDLSTSTLTNTGYGSPGDRLKLIARLDGLQTGAMAAADITVAADLDDAARGRIDALRTAVSCISLPSVANRIASGVEHYGLDYVQNLTIDRLTEWGGDQVGGAASSASNWSTRHRELAIDDADALRETREDEIEDYLDKACQTWLGQGIDVIAGHAEPVGGALNEWERAYAEGLSMAVQK